MKQSSLDLNLSTKKTRKQQLLDEMELVVPWAGVPEFLCKRVGLQLTEMRSPN